MYMYVFLIQIPTDRKQYLQIQAGSRPYSGLYDHRAGSACIRRAPCGLRMRGQIAYFFQIMLNMAM
jgi:hypothetical protein